MSDNTPDTIRPYFNEAQLDALSKEIRTIPVDGEGRALAVNYNEHFVRDIVTKLIHDAKRAITLQAKLDAKDTEIAELKQNREGVMNYLDDLHMNASGEPAMIFMTMLVELFEQNGGKNFLTLTVEKPDQSARYSITIQNLNGELSPSEKMDQMQAEIAFWREAAETQKDNNLAILAELQSLKEPNT